QSPSHVESWRQAPPARARFSPCSAKTGSCLRLVRADLAYVQAEARTITRLVGRTEVRTKERPHDGSVQAVSEGNCDGSVDAALRDSQPVAAVDAALHREAHVLRRKHVRHLLDGLLGERVRRTKLDPAAAGFSCLPAGVTDCALVLGVSGE